MRLSRRPHKPHPNTTTKLATALLRLSAWLLTSALRREYARHSRIREARSQLIDATLAADPVGAWEPLQGDVIQAYYALRPLNLAYVKTLHRCYPLRELLWRVAEALPEDEKRKYRAIHAECYVKNPPMP